MRLIVLSAFSILLLSTPHFEMQRNEVAYRLLQSRLPKAGDSLKEVGIFVSVERPLKEPEIRTLVCEIFKKEKPPEHERVVVSIFVDLDELIPALGSPILERKNAEHQLAIYMWAHGVPDRRRLSITMDSDGKLLSPWRHRDFDHTKDCTR